MESALCVRIPRAPGFAATSAAVPGARGRTPVLTARLPLALAALVFLLAPAAEAASLYAIRDLGANVSNLRLNASGDVAGTRTNAAGPAETFVNRGGVDAVLENFVVPLHLADDGRIIGASLPGPFYDGRARGPNGYSYDNWSLADPVAANDRGQTVGMQSGYHSRRHGDWNVGKAAYLYTPYDEASAWTNRTGAVRDYAPRIGGLADAYPGQMNFRAGVPTLAETYPNAINDQGVVAGAYLQVIPASADGKTPEQWSTRAFVGNEAIGTLPGGSRSIAWDVNEAGHAVGNSGTSTAQHAFLYRDGALIDLGTLIPDMIPDSKYNGSVARALNNLDQVVGQSSGPSYDPRSWDRAFLYDPALARMLDLNVLIGPDTGWLLTDAIDINDSGQILGYGKFGGQSHGYLLTPLQATPAPEPTTLAVLVLASGALWLRRRRRG